MPNIKLMESGLPVAPLKIGALESCRELGEKVNDYIVQFRKSTMDKNTDSPLYYNYLRDNYLIDCPCPRFGSGEAKGLLTESIRGTDLFLMGEGGRTARRPAASAAKRAAWWGRAAEPGKNQASPEPAAQGLFS